ncbi:hypothetical protein WH367_10775 [Comamonas sp. MYb21]|uniref:hypothetical protein n=1 Tax=Comamonas sp. MYb21 TaxID=1848648 RepID=UPI0030A949F1
MSARWNGTRRVFKLVALGCTAVAAGCTSFPRNEPGTGFGEITVDSPRVETSDRLINDRREKEHWLTLRRNEVRDAKLGVSGLTSLTSMSFIGAQANVSIDPLRGLQNIDIARDIQAAQSQANDQKALDAVRATVRDDIIAKYNKKEITAKQLDEQLKEIGLTAAATPRDTPTATTSNPAASAPSSTLITANKDVLTAPAAPAAPTQLSSTPVQDFYDRLAAYDTIDSEIFATRGDDVHDLDGNTLYRLAFDTTVLPTNDTSAWAVVTIKLRPQLDGIDYTKLLANSLLRQAALITQTNERSYRVTMRALGKECWAGASKAATAAKGGDDFGVFAKAFRCATSDLGSNFRAALERHLSAGVIANTQVLSCGPDCNWLKARRTSIGSLYLEKNDTPEAEAKFSEWAIRVAQIFDAQTKAEFQASPASQYATLVVDSSQPGHFPYVLQARRGPIGEQLKTKLLANLKASVYEVVPKETVQQLSEVSSNRKSAELLLGLAASKGNVGLNAALQSIKSNTAQYEALRRQPLVVAFTRRGNTCSNTSCAEALEFGWIFGPSFVLSSDGKSTRFRHATARKTVAASLSLPAWVDGMAVEVNTHWIREADLQSVPTGISPTHYRVPLPSRYGDVFAGVGDHHEREPRVDEFQDIQVTEDAPAAVNIRGRDLWRSTAVHIGAQRADLITIHPDRRGITANFDKIASGAGSEMKNGRVKLTLQTSEGDVLAGAVTVKSKTAAAKDDPAPLKISGMPARIVAEAQQAIELNNALAVTDEAILQVTSPQDTSLNVQLTATTQVAADRKNILFTLPEKTVPNLISGDLIAISLAVKHGKSGGTEIFDVRKPVVFYKKADELKARLVAPNKLAQVLKFKIDLPLNAGQAFTAFAGGAAKITASVVIDDVKDKPAQMEGTCKIAAVKGRRKAGDRDSCSFELQGARGWTSAVKKAVDVSVAFAEKDAPELDGAGPVKLTK